MCNWCHFRYFLYFLYRQRHRQRQRQISWVWGVVVLLAPLQISFLWASLFVFAAEPLGRENVRCKMRGGLWKALDKTIQSSFSAFGTIRKCLQISGNSKNHSILFFLDSIQHMHSMNKLGHGWWSWWDIWRFVVQVNSVWGEPEILGSEKWGL